ncbi:MAG: zinc ABC transporter substrate-binding protein [Chloroflexi bacterium]|nr:zinc ABC transporter substrate-binding protein [Chloroflexota bacterium]
MKSTIDKLRPLLIHSIKHSRRGLSISLVIASIAIVSVACSVGSDDTKTSVVTTLYPLEYFAQRIGGDDVSVTNLLKPGVEAHSFEPTPADIRKLEAADVIVYNGSGLEPWIDRALSTISSSGGPRLIVEASYEWQQESNAGEIDPHVWLDPLKSIELVKLIRDGITSANPDGAAIYATNATGLLTKLLSLHQTFVEGLADCSLDSFVTSHAAFGHLAERYSLEQIPISGLSPEAAPGPADLARIADTIRELGMSYVMVEPIISAAYAETLAREINARLLPLHPLESLTPDESESGEDYFSIMENNLENLRLALECKR